MKAAHIVLGSFLSIEEIDLCFFFPGSVIFLNADKVSKLFIFMTNKCDMITW